MTKQLTSPDGKRGLYDGEDKCWIGTTEAPLRYNDEELAQIAARMYDVQVGNYSGRTRATEFDPGVNKKKDEVKPKMSAEEALRRIEEGLSI